MSLFCNDVHSAAAAGHGGVHVLPVLAARLAHRVDDGLLLRPLTGNNAPGDLVLRTGSCLQLTEVEETSAPSTDYQPGYSYGWGPAPPPPPFPKHSRFRIML